MGLTFHQDDKGLWVLRAEGVLRKAELDTVQQAMVGQLTSAGNARVLVQVEDSFRGWEKNSAWGDLTFFVEHGDKIGKMAVVADPKWEAEMMVFAGAGFRRAPVRFFPTGQLAAARAWLE